MLRRLIAAFAATTLSAGMLAADAIAKLPDADRRVVAIAGAIGERKKRARLAKPR